MQKTTLIFLTLVFISVNAVSQNDTINQIDKNGFKIGYWIYYYNNGNIESKGNYKVLPINQEELFMRGIYSEDSIIYYSRKYGKWLYYYVNGKLIYDNTQNIYERKNKVDNRIIHINAHIFDTLRVRHLKHEINEKDTVSNILNLTNKKYIFNKGFLSDSIKIIYKNPDNKFKKIKIYSFGYHISTTDLSEDFENMVSFEVMSDTLFFYRMFRACEMKIYKYTKHLNKDYITSGKAIPKLIIPISLNSNNIDISNLRKGKYLLRTVNYDYSINLFAIIELK